MSATGSQCREQIVNFLLQQIDVYEKEVIELQKQVTDLRKQLESASQKPSGA
jgi:hypothetical protein